MMQFPQCHPNLIPVNCANQEDMKKLAQQMRALCLQDPDKIEGYEGSETETKAQWRAVKAMARSSGIFQ